MVQTQAMRLIHNGMHFTTLIYTCGNLSSICLIFLPTQWPSLQESPKMDFKSSAKKGNFHWWVLLHAKSAPTSFQHLEHNIKITKQPSMFPDWSLVHYILHLFALFHSWVTCSVKTHQVMMYNCSNTHSKHIMVLPAGKPWGYVRRLLKFVQWGYRFWRYCVLTIF